MLKRIKLEKKVRIDELDRRLRGVRLKGFPEIRAYEDADISIKAASPDYIKNNLFTPQPTIYADLLERIEKIIELFFGEGIDVLRLEEGYDYVAFDEKGEATNWTIIPPVVEFVPIKFNEGRLDYSESFRDDLMKKINELGHGLNPKLKELEFEEYRRFFGVQSIPLICDGSHRIHVAFEKGMEQNLLFINGPKVGVPYYAAPKPYSAVHVIPTRDDSKSEKTHILTEPGHKLLYRLFPSGGLHTGDVRKPTTN
jgi:hypothetical protein